MGGASINLSISPSPFRVRKCTSRSGLMPIAEEEKLRFPANRKCGVDKEKNQLCLVYVLYPIWGTDGKFHHGFALLVVNLPTRNGFGGLLIGNGRRTYMVITISNFQGLVGAW